MVLALSLSISLLALSLSLFLSAVLTGFTFDSIQVEEAFRRVEDEDAEGTLQDVQTMSRSLRGRSSSRPGSASRVTDDSVEPRKRKTQAEIQSIKLRLRKKKELKQKTTGAKKKKNLSMCAWLVSISLFVWNGIPHVRVTHTSLINFHFVVADPFCDGGVLSFSGLACCARSCGSCGGRGCGGRTGGATNCCPSKMSACARIKSMVCQCL